MANEIIMPKAGMDMEEGTIVKWLVSEGDKVDTGDPILEILTDKVNMEVEAETPGTILKIVAKEGDVLPVFTVIGYIGKEGEQPPEGVAPEAPAKEEKPAEEAKAAPVKEEPSKQAQKQEDEYDVVVLGAGPGGYVAAIRAAQLGAKTAIVEAQYFGGTCLNVGCIPTKTLVKNAEILHQIEHAGSKGIIVGKPEIDMKKVKQNKDSVVKKLTGGIGALLKSNGITIIDGVGSAGNDDTVKIVEGKDKGKTVKYDKLIIATGSLPLVPPIPGLDLPGIMTSTEILDLEEIPKELVVIGGGVIGCEFATIYNSFGTKVTIVEMMPKLIPNMDAEVSAELEKQLKKAGIKVMTDSKVEKVETAPEGFSVTVSGKDETSIKAEKVLVSIGRKANMKGLEDLDIKKDRTIAVDDYLRTSKENVYAVGDITGKIQLAHWASAQGMKAAENAMGASKKMDCRFVPSCIYTIPEIGSVGLTEEEARQKYDVAIGRFPMMVSGKAIAMGETEGFVKIITDKKYGEILGVHIVGPNATELVAEVTAVMKLEGTIEELGDIIHPHPTISESIMEAAHAVHGECIHLPKK
ncbi:dihydrolipoyl dehydrogenase [Alkalibacter saccharofermentans]|uniref:Dihydrolipoyl dehydrogenase n=1 Tax=Alkalibacter saccharofermentans DSM 14828 TaxID=1120975 RepID=A0A1M4X2N1_9FIRM|nr:dihydrolipoyl dehydrogenase [Alkalibacter saccharofermentans]SHE87754.1 dihydrolipoamide dehydrogenase [Alkalibacter saccharofermentans DSM 14828]